MKDTKQLLLKGPTSKEKRGEVGVGVTLTNYHKLGVLVHAGTLALGRSKQENLMFKAILDHIARPCFTWEKRGREGGSRGEENHPCPKIKWL